MPEGILRFYWRPCVDFVLVPRYTSYDGYRQSRPKKIISLSTATRRRFSVLVATRLWSLIIVCYPPPDEEQPQRRRASPSIRHLQHWTARSILLDGEETNLVVIFCIPFYVLLSVRTNPAAGNSLSLFALAFDRFSLKATLNQDAVNIPEIQSSVRSFARIEFLSRL